MQVSDLSQPNANNIKSMHTEQVNALVAMAHTGN